LARGALGRARPPVPLTPARRCFPRISGIQPEFLLATSRVGGLSACPAKFRNVQDHVARRTLGRRLIRRGPKGPALRIRYAADLIAAVWILAVIVFGTVEHLIDSKTFPTVWLGMWWALQTVTMVGYGDVVPAQTSGMIIASFLLTLALLGPTPGGLAMNLA